MMRANLYSLYDFTSFSKELQELEVKKYGGKIQKQTSLNVEETSNDSSRSSS